MMDFQKDEAIAEKKLEADKESIYENTKTVRIVGLDIPFGDVMSLTFKGFCASLIIAIPIVFIFLMIIDS
tara:strand:- start:162 stop:371 length:210 start_codon:yes stop_codon:yes gene_type:complete